MGNWHIFLKRSCWETGPVWSQGCKISCFVKCEVTARKFKGAILLLKHIKAEPCFFQHRLKRHSRVSYKMLAVLCTVLLLTLSYAQEQGEGMRIWLWEL